MLPLVWDAESHDHKVVYEQMGLVGDYSHYTA